MVKRELFIEKYIYFLFVNTSIILPFLILFFFLNHIHIVVKYLL